MIQKENQEILLIDKPKGISSFDVIRRLKKIKGKLKMGHAGTLDPLASGLMIIGVEKGTKKLTDLIKLKKTYEAEIILGEKRTTGDLEGEIIEQIDIEKWEPENTKEVKSVLKTMVGILNLPVPVYSAIKKNGVPLYKKARKGEKIDIPIRKMEIINATLNEIKKVDKKVYVQVVFDVGSGTYIRSLAEELGKRLDLPATLGNLRRIKVGDFDVKDAITV